MSLPPSENGNETGSNLQRIAIGAGTVIVVILTVAIAIFLTIEETPDSGLTPEPVAVASTTATGVTPSPPTGDATTVAPSVTETPSSTPTATPTTPSPTSTPTPTPTNTPLPVQPTEEETSSPAETPPTQPPPPPAATPSEPPADQTPPPCQPPADWVEYLAQVGDTYDSLARRTGTSVADLLEVNCPETATLQAGTPVWLPMTPPTPTITYTPTSTEAPAATPTRTATPVHPEIDEVAPNRVGEDNDEFIMTVRGENFRIRESGFRVELRGPRTISLPLRETTLSETNFDVIVPAALDEGTYDLVVTNPDGRSGIRSSALTVGPATATPIVGPEITDVDPESGLNDRDRIIEVRGRRFKPNENGFRVELRIGDQVEEVLDVVGTATETSFSARVPAGLPADIYDLWVINPDGQDDVEPAAYEVRNP